MRLFCTRLVGSIFKVYCGKRNTCLDFSINIIITFMIMINQCAA